MCSNNTYTYKGIPQWHHNQDNLICKACYDKQWRAKYPAYYIVYRAMYRDYLTFHALIRRSIKRGWGRTD
jgi:hypothetical protein